jgi:hypothetical protein
VHQLHLFGRSGVSRRKKQQIKYTMLESHSSFKTHRWRNKSGTPSLRCIPTKTPKPLGNEEKCLFRTLLQSHL